MIIAEKINGPFSPFVWFKNGKNTSKLPEVVLGTQKNK